MTTRLLERTRVRLVGRVGPRGRSREWAQRKRSADKVPTLAGAQSDARSSSSDHNNTIQQFSFRSNPTCFASFVQGEQIDRGRSGCRASTAAPRPRLAQPSTTPASQLTERPPCQASSLALGPTVPVTEPPRARPRTLSGRSPPTTGSHLASGLPVKQRLQAGGRAYEL